MIYSNRKPGHPGQQDDYKKFCGKYRGKVIENEDPELLGRIIANVPAIPGSKNNFAMPCVPYAGPGVSFLALPPIGANVWIEFEGGDPNFPIWSGGFWGPEDEMPKEAASPDIKIFKTKHITMVLDDQEKNKGGFKLTCNTPAVKTNLAMTFNSEGITVKCPKSVITMTKDTISLTVPKSVISIKSGSIKASVPKSDIEIISQKINAQSPPAKLTITSKGIDANAPGINAKGGTSIMAKAPAVSISGLVKMN